MSINGSCVNQNFLSQFSEHHNDQSLLTLVRVDFTLYMGRFRLEIELLGGIEMTLLGLCIDYIKAVQLYINYMAAISLY